MITFEVISPSQYKKFSHNCEISYGFHPTLFGKCFIGIIKPITKFARGTQVLETYIGENRSVLDIYDDLECTTQLSSEVEFQKRFIAICHLSFVDCAESLAIQMLRDKWPQAQLKEDSHGTGDIIKSIFVKNSNICQNFHLILQGTDFQIKVWQALVSVPEGKTMSYENIACMIGKPKAVRAVANAIANNPIAYLIPCHRIICKSGKIHKYRWGALRKKEILTYEGFESNNLL